MSLVVVSGALLVSLTGCGGGDALPLGESDSYGDGTMTVTAVEERSAADIAMLESLDEVEGQTPYFLRYEVDFGSDTDPSVPATAWNGETTDGPISPVQLFGIGEFECDGLGEITDNKASGCQLVFAQPGATLESVSIGSSGPWAVDAD